MTTVAATLERLITAVVKNHLTEHHYEPDENRIGPD